MYLAVAHMQSALLGWQTQQLHQSLAQVQLEVEQDTQRVEATIPHDPFAAAVLARGTLNRTSRLTVNDFFDIHSKRAWSDMTTRLQRAARPGDPRVLADVDGYCARMDQLVGFQRHMAGAPEQYLARFQAAYDAIWSWWVWGGAAITCVVLMFVVAANPQTRILVAVFLIVGVLCFVQAVRGALDRSEAWRLLNDASRFANGYAAFWNDSNGGGVLSRAWKEHRLLWEHPPALPPSSQRGPASIVERQVVVTRCKYCSKMTQVDRPTCEHCGAAGYGGLR